MQLADPTCRKGDGIDHLRMAFEWACDELAVERVAEQHCVVLGSGYDTSAICRYAESDQLGESTAAAIRRSDRRIDCAGNADPPEKLGIVVLRDVRWVGPSGAARRGVAVYKAAKHHELEENRQD